MESKMANKDSEDANKSLAITLANVSSVTLNLAIVRVNEGYWSGMAPTSGTAYRPGDSFYAVNAADNSYGAVSGYLKFELSSGGYLIAQWTWEFGKSLSVATYCDSDQLTVEYDTFNSQSNSATFQITVSNG
jgi:hypothetical protein